MNDDGSGAVASGSSDPHELTELDATIRNSAADIETAKSRLAKETSDHHKRVHQQRLDEATTTFKPARARKDYLRQANLDPQVKSLEVNRKGVALKREQTALEAQLRKAADDAATAKEQFAEVAQKCRDNRAAIEAIHIDGIASHTHSSASHTHDPASCTDSPASHPVRSV